MPDDAAKTSRQLADVYRAGQERLSLTGALVAYEAWKRISVTDPVLTPAFITAVLTVVHALRWASWRLAARYYNLARAIGTAHAYPDIESRFTVRASLEDVYSAMATSINEVATATTVDLQHLDAMPAPRTPVAVTGSAVGASESAPRVIPAQDRKKGLEARTGQLEDFVVRMFQDTFPADADLAADVQIEQAAWPDFGDEKTFDENLLAELEAKSVKDLKAIVDRELASQQSMSDSLSLINDAAEKRGAVGAGLVGTDIVDPGRRLLHEVGTTDGRRVAWMRVTGAHPCGFCSMLASRGAVYRSEETAGGFGNLYHPNDQCGQVPLFTEQPHLSTRDQYFQDNWETGSNGQTGKAALRAWRSWLTDQYNKGLVPAQNE